MQLVAVQAQHVVELRLKAAERLLLDGFDALRVMLELFSGLIGASQSFFQLLRTSFKGLTQRRGLFLAFFLEFLPADPLPFRATARRLSLPLRECGFLQRAIANAIGRLPLRVPTVLEVRFALRQASRLHVPGSDPSPREGLPLAASVFFALTCQFFRLAGCFLNARGYLAFDQFSLGAQFLRGFFCLVHSV